ncbi:hypothetical protein FQA39_LY01969 [Lamprigera yunnana]|nr:hypothetical protein FQA39_LY01969 [Lamprigera yunnana]
MFREDFNKFKGQNPLLSDVLRFDQDQHENEKVVQKIEIGNVNFMGEFGLRHPKEWKVYQLAENPGLMFIKNPFTPIGQRYWIRRCLKDFTKKPNKLNLDIHNIIPCNEEWWTFSQKNNSVLNKLRWATLGYHHNWDTKVYSEDSKGDFPLDLACLTKYVADLLNFEGFNAEAAIVNFYHMNSRLSGHTDHSEQYLEAPLFSFSFGQSAIFLIGGLTLDVKPTALLLDSGDIVVMSKESRLCYHGVPKILQSNAAPWNSKNVDENLDITKLECDILQICKDEQNWMPFENYVNNSRINVNVRQVLREGCRSLNFMK